ncbi:alpha/beta-hydrolase [Clavulina sp. PMI_390]|nr:alpha/beta-hydrolase [Clavulina sp. PMI_390]
MRYFLFIIKRKDVIAPRGPQTLDFPPPNLDSCSADRWESKDWKVVELIPPPSPNGARSKRVMMYMYGAGFQRPIHPRQWGFASYMAQKLDADTSVMPYPLPPLNNAKEVIPALIDVYRAFLDRSKGREVIILADSGGAHVTLCLLYALLQAPSQIHPFPHQLILISPNLNSEMNNPAMHAVAPFDPALSPAHCTFVNRLWAGGDPSQPISPEDAKNPSINPMAGDLRLLKQAETLPNPSGLSHQMAITLVSGGYDVLHPDILVWLDKAEQAGVEVHYIEGTQQIHDFPTGRKLIWEGKVATDRVAEIVLQASAARGF